MLPKAKRRVGVVDELLSNVQSFSLTGYIVVTMLAMGMKLALSQIRETFSRRRLISMSLLANLLIVPAAAGIALQVFDGLPDNAIIAIVLLASAPGYAPIMSVRSHGDVAFSTTLIFLLSAVSVITIPITASLLFAGQADVDVDPWSIVQTLLLFQLIPLGLGMWFRSGKLEQAEQWAPKLTNLAQVLVGVAVLTYLIDLIRDDGTPLIDMGWQSFVVWAFVTVVALGSGYWLGGPHESARRTLSLHTAIRNVGVSLLVAARSFPDMGAEVGLLALALVMYPMAMALMFRWEREPVG
jgi:BASS family bile acid:Na+ symporter